MNQTCAARARENMQPYTVRARQSTGCRLSDSLLLQGCCSFLSLVPASSLLQITRAVFDPAVVGRGCFSLCLWTMVMQAIVLLVMKTNISAERRKFRP